MSLNIHFLFETEIFSRSKKLGVASWHLPPCSALFLTYILTRSFHPERIPSTLVTLLHIWPSMLRFPGTYSQIFCFVKSSIETRGSREIFKRNHIEDLQVEVRKSTFMLNKSINGSEFPFVKSLYYIILFLHSDCWSVFPRGALMCSQIFSNWYNKIDQSGQNHST